MTTETETEPGAAAHPHEPEAVPGTETGPPPRRRRRWLRRLAWCAGLSVVFVVVVYLTREVALHPVLARLVHWAAPRFSDYEVELEALHGSWFGDLALEGLVVRPTNESASLRSLEARAVGVEFALLELVRGRLEGLHTVRLEGARVALALGPAAEPAPSEEPAAWPALPERLPRVDVTNVDFELVQEGLLVRIEGLALDVAESAGGRQALALDVGRAALGDPASPTAVEGLVLRGGWGGETLAIDELRAGGRELLAPSSIDLSELAAERVGWDLHVTALDGDAAFAGSLAEGRVETRIDAAGLRLDALRELGLDLALEGTAGLAGSASLPLADALAGRAELTLTGSDVTYEGRHVDRLAADFSLDRGGVRVTSIDLEGGANRVTGTDLFVPLEPLDLDAILSGARGSVDARLGDLAELFQGLTLPAGEPIPAHELVLGADVADGVARVREGRLTLPEGTLTITAGEIDLVAGADGQQLLFDLVADVGDLAGLGPILGTPPWAGTLGGDVHVEGTLPDVAARVDLAGEGVVAAGVPLGAVRVSAHGDAERVQVDAFSATGEGFELALSGGYRIADERMDSVALHVDVREPERFTELIAPGGEVTVDANLDGPLLAPTGTLDAASAGLRVGGVELSDLALRAVAEAGAIDVQELRAQSPYGRLTAALDIELPAPAPEGARPAPLVIGLRELALAGEGGELALQAPAALTLADGDVRLDELRLSGSAGELRVAANVAGADTDVTLSARGLDPFPFAGGFVPEGYEVAGVDLALELHVAGDALRARGGGTVATLRTPLDPEPMALAFEGSYADGRAVVEELRLDAGGQALVDLSASLPLDLAGETPFADGELTVRGQVSLPRERTLQLSGGANPTTLSGEVDAQLDLGGSWSALSGSLVIDAPSIALGGDASTATYLPRPGSVECTLRLDSGVTVERLVVDAPDRGHVELTGRVGLPLDLNALTALDPAALEETALKADGSLRVDDLAWVAGLSDAVRRLGGRLEGTFGADGTLGEPGLTASAELRGGLVKLSTMPQLSGLELDLTVANESLSIARLEAVMGAAPLRATGSVDWSGSEPRLELTVDGENVLLSRSSSALIRADFVGVKAAGPLSALAATGKVRLRNSRVMQNIDLLGWTQRSTSIASAQSGLVLPGVSDPPLSKMTLKLDVETDEPILLFTNVARGGMRVKLEIGGTAEVPTPTGRVFLEPTRVSLPGGVLRLTGGYIEFDEKNPFVPSLAINGETRLAGYDVQVVVSGPYDDPVVDLSSSPPLPPDELLLLFLTGQVPTSGGTAAAAQSLTVYIAKDLLSKWASGGNLEGPDEDSFFDRFELQMGQDVSKSGIATIETTYRTFDQLLDGKDAVYVVAERDVYEDYNLGVRFVFRFR